MQTSKPPISSASTGCHKPVESCRVESSRAEFTVYVRQMSFSHPLPRGRTLRVGRGARADIRVDDPSVSREHLLLHVGESRIQVEDLGSSNGTRLFLANRAGRRADDAVTLRPGERYPIGSGDMLRIGSVHALVQEEKPQSAPHHSTNPPPSATGRVLADPEMRRIHELAARAAQSDIAVLITGETGVGKELLASAVHENSRRAGRPFLRLNCAALAENLLESELFGHEKGAFTGAATMRAGLLESTGGGTVFLDEIGEMPLSTQAKLLRVLEERKIRRLGSSKSIPIDVRFVSATNRDLEAEVRVGRFRSDLYYRISGIALCIPPLRERPTEIEPIARYLLKDFCLKSGIAIPDFTQAALRALLEYSWPGNVRELKNAMERAPFLSGGAPILPEHLPTHRLMDVDDEVFAEERTDVEGIPLPGQTRASVVSREGGGLREMLEEPRSIPGSARPSSDLSLTHGNSKDFSEEDERRRVIEALEACCGNQTRAAKMLGVSRRTLINRIEAFGLPRPRKNG